MKGLAADEYEALKQARDGFGQCDRELGLRLLERGLLTAPEVVPGQPHPIVRLNKVGRLAILCHELASRTYGD